MEPTAGIKEKWQYNSFMFRGTGCRCRKNHGTEMGAKHQNEDFCTPKHEQDGFFCN
jgi:hypothetical protein